MRYTIHAYNADEHRMVPTDSIVKVTVGAETEEQAIEKAKTMVVRENYLVVGSDEGALKIMCCGRPVEETDPKYQRSCKGCGLSYTVEDGMLYVLRPAGSGG